MDSDTLYPTVRFGPYEVVFGEGVLLKRGHRLKIQAKPLAILQLLVSKPGEIVSREELRKALWRDDVFVDFDKNLATAINKLRAVLGDSADSPRYIETIPRRGYRFLAPVEVVEHGSAATPLPEDRSLPAESAQPRKPVIAKRGFPPAAHRTFWVGAAVGGAAVIALLVLLASWPGSKAKPGQTYRIVLGGFQNSTGDPVFDNTLRQGLWSQLEQSPYLNLLSNTRIGQTLALMERPSNTFLSPDVAREVCQRNAGAAAIGGSISSMGDQYVIGLTAVDCQDGNVLADEQVTADGKQQVLATLYKASRRLRRKLGESLASIRKYSAPLEDVTTTSLEALQAYSIGYHILMVKNNSHPAIPFFQRAVRLDPNFAMAYAMLGKSYQSDQEEGLGTESFTKAYHLLKHASAAERFFIEAYYQFIAKGNLEAAERIFQLWARTYPADYLPHAALGNIYVDLGEFERSLAERRTALKLDPSIGLNYGNLEVSMVWLHRYSEAFALAREAQERGMDSPEVHLVVAWIPWSEGKLAERDKWLAPVANDPALAQWAMEEDAVMDAYAGQMAKSRALTRAAMDGFRRVGRPEAGPLEEARLAVNEALVGEYPHAKEFAQAALGEDAGREVRAGAAIALALAGNGKEASRMADQLSTEYPDATDVQRNFVPSIRAAIALRGGHPQKAIQALAPATPYELGNIGYHFVPLYLRGMAFLALRNGAQTSHEFAKLIVRCPAFARLTCPLAQLQLARAYQMMGETANAKNEYAGFFAVWKDADPGIPILTQARAEYARLLHANSPRSLAKALSLRKVQPRRPRHGAAVFPHPAQAGNYLSAVTAWLLSPW